MVIGGGGAAGCVVAARLADSFSLGVGSRGRRHAGRLIALPVCRGSREVPASGRAGGWRPTAPSRLTVWSAVVVGCYPLAADLVDQVRRRQERRFDPACLPGPVWSACRVPTVTGGASTAG